MNVYVLTISDEDFGSTTVLGVYHDKANAVKELRRLEKLDDDSVYTILTTELKD